MTSIFHRSLLFAIACALLTLGTTGCQTTHTFAAPDSTWKEHIGQLKHTNNKRTLVGEVVVQHRGTQEFQLDFLKGGSIPLVSIRQDGDAARAEGLLAGMGGRWQGTTASAPASLRPWLNLRNKFATAQAGHASTPSLTFEDGGQRFEFIFNR